MKRIFVLRRTTKVTRHFSLPFNPKVFIFINSKISKVILIVHLFSILWNVMNWSQKLNLYTEEKLLYKLAQCLFPSVFFFVYVCAN